MIASNRVFELSLCMDGVQVDLHRDPMSMVLVSPDEEDRWARTTELVLSGNHTIRTLDLEDTAIHTLLHLFRDTFADLLHLNDIRLIAAESPDWDEIDRRTTVDGTRDLVRFAAHTASTLLGQPSPLPTSIPRWKHLWYASIWRDSLLLNGHDSHTKSLRRQFALGPTLDAPASTLARTYARRLFPPRQILDHRYGDSNAPYPVKLAKWRLSQHDDVEAFERNEGGIVR